VAAVQASHQELNLGVSLPVTAKLIFSQRVFSDRLNRDSGGHRGEEGRMTGMRRATRFFSYMVLVSRESGQPRLSAVPDTTNLSLSDIQSSRTKMLAEVLETELDEIMMFPAVN
jgi:hypothetical protein